ncbi:hypothetical protein SLEP1_g17943 [Rubroshorea leprosula]|uniref:Uncharacterized protein n=1 Tax=Rubroshorea leprosula TaxID=152421 RepID=A0AAV5J3F7_9ROSI|nr:hypothetical protein SLEP1_g17943 [Rubroshorea leprosula]
MLMINSTYIGIWQEKNPLSLLMDTQELVPGEFYWSLMPGLVPV